MITPIGSHYVLGYMQRTNAVLSALLGKSVEHAHRYSAFIQTIEYGYSICQEYLVHSKVFPEGGEIDAAFVGELRGIFDRLFVRHTKDGHGHREFVICEEVVIRAIDLISGQMQQLQILMDDTNAPALYSNQNRPVVVLPMNVGQGLSEVDSRKKTGKKNGSSMNVLVMSLQLVFAFSGLRIQ